MSVIMKKWSFVLAYVLIFQALPATAGEGFGTFKKDLIRLERINPPEVYIRGTRLGVTVTAQDRQWQDLGERLRSALESEMLNADRRLSSEPTSPETVIELTVIENSAGEEWRSQEEVFKEQVGKDNKGKPVYRDVTKTVRYKSVSARMGAAFKVQELRSKRTLAADTVRYTFSQEFREGKDAPDSAGLEGQGINWVVGRIVLRLAPSKEVIGVLVPRGSLEVSSNLAKARLWSKYQESLEALGILPDSEAESYRQYALGLAYEAQGYGAETTGATLRYLQQAASHYNTALEMNPGEKYFTLPYNRNFLGQMFASDKSLPDTFPPPHERVAQSLIKYQRSLEFEEMDVEVAAEVGAKSLAATEAPAALGNREVIDMAVAGLTEDVILTAIQDAAETAFDASPKGLIELSKGGVSKKIIQRIQALAAKKPAPKPPGPGS